MISHHIQVLTEENMVASIITNTTFLFVGTIITQNVNLRACHIRIFLRTLPAFTKLYTMEQSPFFPACDLMKYCPVNSIDVIQVCSRNWLNATVLQIQQWHIYKVMLMRNYQFFPELFNGTVSVMTKKMQVILGLFASTYTSSFDLVPIYML